MDTNENKPQTLVEALRIVRREFLYSPGDLYKPFHICIASATAQQHGRITFEQDRQIISAIHKEIYPSSTLAAHLHNRGLLPEEVKRGFGYAVNHPKYLKLRDKFLDDMEVILTRLDAMAAGKVKNANSNLSKL